MLVDAFDFPNVGVYSGLVEGDLHLCLKEKKNHQVREYMVTPIVAELLQ